MQHVSCYWPFSSQFFGGFNFCRAHTLVFRLKLVKFAPISDPIWWEVQTKSNYFGSKFCVFSCKGWLNQNPHLKKINGSVQTPISWPHSRPCGQSRIEKILLSEQMQTKLRLIFRKWSEFGRFSENSDQGRCMFLWTKFFWDKTLLDPSIFWQMFFALKIFWV